MRFLGALALVSGVLALPGAASATPVPLTLSRSVAIGGSGVTSATLTCPRATLALSGYVTSLSSGAVSRDSIPADLRRWRFELGARGGGGSARVGLRCLRLSVPSGLRNVHTRAFSGQGVVRAPARSSVTTRLRCPAGFVPTGYGFNRSAAPRALALASAVPASRSWSFRVENTGRSNQTGVLRLRCIGARATATRSGRTLTQRFSIVSRAFTDSVAGKRVLAHGCHRGSFSLVAGHVVRAADDTAMRLQFASGSRSGRWDVRNPRGRAERVRTYLSCLSLGTRFR